MNFPNQEISQIMTIESNKTCVDCLAPNPTFASVNNSVFICETCANMHKGLGKNISEVKSLMNDQFTPEEICLLKIGGNARFNALMGEFAITSEQNKEFKYHLKITDYYRRLLVAEKNKSEKPDEYQNLLNNKPNPEIGLQIMETVTVDSINQAQQENQSELSKDAKDLANKITGFFSEVGNAIQDTAQKYGIDKKINEVKEMINEGCKDIGEKYPTVQNAATATMGALKAAGDMATETANKIANLPAMQSLSQRVNETYSGIVNSETVKLLSKKAEEQYVALKAKAKEKFGSNNNQQPPQPPQ